MDWEVDSAGTSGHMPGCPPHQYSQKVARLHGVDMCNQVCRNFTSDDMNEFDKIYVMDDNNYFEVKRIAGNNWDKNKVDYLLNEIYPGSNKEVPDPWYGGEDGFHKVYEMIDKACTAIIKKYALAKI